MIILGYGGMPRRYATYLPQFTSLHQIATLGAVIITIGQLVWLYNMLTSWMEGPKADPDPWDLDGTRLKTAEWQWFEQKRELAIADGGGTSDRDE
jgi:cytochrome c oxidase subunit 1